jgi:protein SCO1/2
MRRPLLYGLAGALLIVLVGALTVPRLLSSSESYNGTLVDATGEPEEFQLASAAGDVQLSDFRGRLVVMYFGYTSCPDFCPATLAKLAQVRERLGGDAEGVQILMITVDPERDDPERLAQFVTSFDGTFVGLSGSEEQLRNVASQFGIFFQKQEGSEATGYLVDHTTTLVVLDRDGRERLYLGWDLTAEQIENDLRNLIS